MKKILFAIAILTTCTAAGAAFAQSAAPAAQQTQPAQAEASSISLAPARFEAEMAPGSETTFVVNLNYRGGANAGPSRIAVSLNDWTMSPDGQINFMKAGTGPRSASSWIIFSPSNAVVIPGQNNAIRVTISVPADASPGDHIAALIIEPRTDNALMTRSARQIMVRYRMATMIYVKVPKLTRQASLENLIASNGTAGISVTPTLKNAGNSLVRPIYSARVIDSKGETVAEVADAESMPVLAGSELSRQFVIEKTLAAGKYTVKYRVDFLDGSDVIEGETEVSVN